MPSSAESTFLGSLGSAAKGVGDMLVGAFAPALNVFSSAVGAVRGFVDALSPAAGMVLDQTLRDLAATVGTALEPVIQVATQVVQDFARSLAPVMERLKPIVEQSAKAFSQVANVVSG